MKKDVGKECRPAGTTGVLPWVLQDLDEQRPNIYLDALLVQSDETLFRILFGVAGVLQLCITQKRAPL